jgi:CheY-like chemotaxis protein
MPAPNPERARKRILIVDDDHDIRESLAEVLAELGFQVATVANGREALAELEREPATAVLLDLMMPVMDGWQFREEQRRRPALARTPVIVVSADGDVRASAAAIGADAWLRKPIHIADLLALLDGISAA